MPPPDRPGRRSGPGPRPGGGRDGGRDGRRRDRADRGADRRPGPADPRQRRPDRHLFGLHAVAEAWINPERTCHRLHGSEAGLAALAPAIEAAKAARLLRPVPDLVDRARLDRLVPPGAVHQGVVLEAAPLPPTALEDLGRSAEVRKGGLVLALDRVTDPHNIGAILRSAAAFGALGLVVTDRHTPEVTGTLAKSASGAVEHVPIVRVTNLAQALATLHGWGFASIGLAQEADATLAEIVPPERAVLVLGAEGEGLRQKTRATCTRLARLPTRPPIASLNVSNAAAVALYALTAGR